LFGTVAILGTFTLARAAGLGRWGALGASALMAADNLMIVHGRIGTLDIYALAAMVWAGTAYLRGRPMTAGILVAVGACLKLVGGYLVLVFALIELMRRLRPQRYGEASIRRLAICGGCAVAAFLGLLAMLDLLAHPYDDTLKRLIAANPFAHFSHMVSYAAHQTSPSGPHGIASYPWTWLVDYKPITYLNVNPSHPVPGLYHVHPAVHFLGLISPPILLVALPAILLAGWRALRSRAYLGDEVSGVAVAWTAGTLLPFIALSLLFQRTSYLYYVLIVMPGLYLAAVWLVELLRAGPRLTAAWALTVLAAAVIAYPLTPLP
jgi:predicted membrane-bound dolichyl-phosphate-mannose-protein mannosyltransferase